MKGWLSFAGVLAIARSQGAGRGRGIAWLVVAILTVASIPIQGRAGLIIDPVFDSSVTSLPNAAQVESAFNYAAGQLEALFSNPVTLTIDVSINQADFYSAYNQSIIYGPDGPIQSTGPNTLFTYSQIVQGLSSNVTSVADASAIANLPATDPTNGGGFVLESAQAKIWGLTSALAGTTYPDGSIFFGDVSAYTFDPSNRAVPGEYDFIGIAEHEITHTMGRVDTNSIGATGSAYSPFDLFHYQAPGDLEVSGGASYLDPPYFSVDGGVTKLSTFGSPDPADWDESQPNDPFDALSTPGVQDVLSTADIDAMNVLGWENAAVPEPADWTFMGLGIVLLFVYRKLSIRRCCR